MTLRKLFETNKSRSDKSFVVNVDIDYANVKINEISEKYAKSEDSWMLYVWYEGVQGLRKKSTDFYKTNLFDPMKSNKSSVKFMLYSLRGWDFNKFKTISMMPLSTPLSDEIQQINPDLYEMVLSFDFFKYCASIPVASPVYQYIRGRLINKQSLIDLSVGRKELGLTVADLFSNKPSIFDTIYSLDVCRAYSLMQYVEGLYLVGEAVKRQLELNSSCINIAFILPNDEGKYYADFPREIEQYLRYCVGECVPEMTVNIRFEFFTFGEMLNDRPYIDKSKGAQKIDAKDIKLYLPIARLSRLGEQKLESAPTIKYNNST